MEQNIFKQNNLFFVSQKYFIIYTHKWNWSSQKLPGKKIKYLKSLLQMSFSGEFLIVPVDGSFGMNVN